MNRTAILLACSVALAAPPLGAQTAMAPPGTVVALALSPAAEPRPALRYLLLPPPLEQQPGNAAIALGEVPRPTLNEQERDNIEQWLTTPLEDLPADQVTEFLRDKAGFFTQLARAVRFERCDWERPMRLEHIALLLPGLGDQRTHAKLLALRIRLATAQGRFDDALEDLKTGLALAQCVAAGPTLVERLVGVSIAAVMLERVEELIQQPGAPNLYWALVNLPRPLVDLGGAMRTESAWVYWSAPELARWRSGKLTPAEWEVGLAKLHAVMGLAVGPQEPATPAPQIAAALAAAAVYPEAKRRLVAMGYAVADVEKMPVAQVIGTYELADYEEHRDDMMKWFGLPYPQATLGLQRAEAAAGSPTAMGNLARALLPALGAAYTPQARLDRKVALLRSVEAIRLYAAAHDGRLPAALDALTDSPAADDPMTGKPFSYRVQDGAGILDTTLPPVRPDPKRDRVRYEIRLRRTTEAPTRG